MVIRRSWKVGRRLARASVVLACVAAPTALPAANQMVILDAGNVSGSSAIAIGPDGLPLVVWSTSDQGLKVAHCGNVSCSAGNTISTIDAAASGAEAIDVATSGAAPAAIRYRVGGSLFIARCGNATCDSSTTQLMGEVSAWEQGSIAIGADGLPVASAGATSGELTVIHCGNATCNSGVLSSGVEGYGDQSAIAISSAGTPLVAHPSVDNVHDLLICGNASCSAGNSEGSILSPQGPYGYRSLAIGTDSRPVVVAHVAADEVIWLTLARCADVACTVNEPFVTLFEKFWPSSEDVLRGPGLAIGADGSPVVSFRDPEADDLKFAYCTNSACDDGGHRWLTIDPTPGVGSQSSLAIGSDGRPIISYFDDANDDLRVLHCGRPRCNEVFASAFEAGDFSGWSLVVGGT